MRCPIRTRTHQPGRGVLEGVPRRAHRQRAALIEERDAGHIDDEAARAMLDRLDLQEAGVTARLESRF